MSNLVRTPCSERRIYLYNASRFLRDRILSDRRIEIFRSEDVQTGMRVSEIVWVSRLSFSVAIPDSTHQSNAEEDGCVHSRT